MPLPFRDQVPTVRIALPWEALDDAWVARYSFRLGNGYHPRDPKHPDELILDEDPPLVGEVWRIDPEEPGSPDLQGPEGAPWCARLGETRVIGIDYPSKSAACLAVDSALRAEGFTVLDEARAGELIEMLRGLFRALSIRMDY